MKNKKVLIVICVFLVIILLGVYYYFMIFKDRPVKLSVYEIGNFTKYEGDIPAFNIRLEGFEKSGVDKYILDANDVPLYRFDAVVNDGWITSSNSYIGYKMIDFLSILKDKNYNSITAYNSNGLKVTYPRDLIDNDSLFIVFYKDGKRIMNKNIVIISVTEGSHYYIDNLVKIEINGMEEK